MSKINFVGMTINDFYIEEQINDTNFKVKCIHCNIETTLSINTLKIGRYNKNSCRCGCTRSGIKPGDKFSRLTVIKRDIQNQPYGRISWICQCECGNYITVIGKSLKDGNTKSCGCLNIENRVKNLSKVFDSLEDLTGQKSGLLTVIRLASKNEVINRPTGNRYWLCQCECGNTHIVSTSDFKMGKVQSCGCLNSKGEAIISRILEENNINYAKQFYFNDLTNKEGYKYYFDFGILDNNKNLLYLIEYDGIQHFSVLHQFSKNKDSLFIIQNRDKIKNDYCFNNNIPLIRIPYTIKQITIDDLLLEKSQYICRKENYDEA